MPTPRRIDRLQVALERSTATQLEAITAPERQLRIIAAAGSGKTRVLTIRLALRVADDALDPTRCLVVTFSRKAADELRSRLFSFGVRGEATSTVHGLAYRLVREFADDRGLRAPEVFTSRFGPLRQVLGDLDGQHPGLSPAALDAEIGWAKTRGLSASDYVEAATVAQRRAPAPRSVVAVAFERYEQLRQRSRLLDFDDLLVEATRLLREEDRFADAVRWRTDHVSLDEAQDLNPAQLALLSALLGQDPDLTFVGDPNQAIYGWNGADPRLMDVLVERYPATRTVHLKANHRSSGAIVQVAAAALGAPGAGRAAKLDGRRPTVHYYPTDDDEARDVAAFCRHEGRRLGAYSAVAILARTNQQLQAIAAHLDHAGVPHRFAGADLAPGVEVARRALAVVADEERADEVVLSTFHRAKGLEWPSVVVVGVAEGYVPIHAAATEAELDEERRLLYVALTRATDDLRITFAERRVVNGVPTGARRAPSRWLADIEHDLQRQADRDAPVLGGARLAILRALRAQLDGGTD